ncbi:MAG: hypothetical protein KF814_02740 [Nitrospiraceae bacterium]|nr:hypothetical protein [Nitrospiraceae bacterium]
MALIQVNLVPGSGDQLLTFDSDTNLEWLNLTATADRSYLDILGGSGGYTTTYGFRYATGAEISTLWQHAGITKFGLGQTVPFPASNHASIEALIQMMNGVALYPSVTRGSVLVQTQGMMQFRGSGTPTPATPMSVAQLWLFKNNPNGSYADTNPGRGAGQRFPEISSYLVRNRVAAPLSPTSLVTRGGKRKQARRSAKT